MKTYEYPAFVVVYADSREEADELASDFANATSDNPEGVSVSLDDGEPTITEED